LNSKSMATPKTKVSPTVFIGADHAGFKLKESLKKFLDLKKIAYKDLGNLKYDGDDDYPEFGIKVAEAVAKNGGKGILVCGSSYGVCVVANKKRGVRAVSIATAEDAKLSRQHNDANILCLSGWNMRSDYAAKIVATFLKTKDSRAVRHVRRQRKIREYEEKTMK